MFIDVAPNLGCVNMDPIAIKVRDGAGRKEIGIYKGFRRGLAVEGRCLDAREKGSEPIATCSFGGHLLEGAYSPAKIISYGTTA
ncbi:MAG: hypothetical protein EOS78_14915 [Mesorhizobium sp.]|nr:MAG: hypothetical protein EOS78_14915 [Mesorhizobium sp.]